MAKTRKITVYLGDDIITYLTIGVSPIMNEQDVIEESAEMVVRWASNNGYVYDKLYWEV